MRRTRAHILAALVVLLLALAGLYIAGRLGPEQLRGRAENALAVAFGGPVSIGHIRLELGLGLRIVADEVHVWPGPPGPALAIERVSATIRPLAYVSGQLKLKRVTLTRARLRVERNAEGHWSPPPFAREPAAEDAPPHPDELLSPLIALENAARFLLTRPRISDHLELRDAEIVLTDAAVGPGAPLTLALEHLEAGLEHRRIRGDARLRLRALLREGDAERGWLECEGTRTRDGAIRIALTTTALDLAPLAPYLRALHPAARLEGTLSGALVFETPAPGDGRLEVDLVARNLTSAAPVALAQPTLGYAELGAPEPEDPQSEAPGVDPPPRAEPFRAERIELVGSLEISPQQVRLRGARLASGDLDLRLEGVVKRPLHPGSRAQLALACRQVDVAQIRHLIGWLPEIEREEAAQVLEPIVGGRLIRLRAGGASSLSGWQSFLAGRTHQPPTDFLLDTELADFAIRVGDSDRIEGLAGRFGWSGDRIAVRDATARLNGSPLPTLDVTLDGFTHFFAGDPQLRVLSSGAEPLEGLRPFWQVMRGDSDDDASTGMQTHVRLEVESLEHPMFLWPIGDLVAEIEPIERGLSIVVETGRWAGVPIEGSAEWLFEPNEQVSVRLEALPEASESNPLRPADHAGSSARSDSSEGWARGRFEVGAIDTAPWRQQRATGRFVARQGRVSIRDAEIVLDPAGHIEASANLDLHRPDAVPFELSFALVGGDVATLAKQLGLPDDVASGHIDLSGSFVGSLAPETAFFASLDGLLEARAAEGTIRRRVPAVVAVALASAAFNPFTARDQVRYERADTILEFRDGLMRTEAFSLDGPDVRVFAAGSVDLERPPHALDAEVALFLFRQIDSVIEKIPILSYLLLGSDDNLVGAYFDLAGPWADPKARLVPIRSLASGPGSIVLEGLPRVVMKGFEAIWEVLGGGRRRRAERQATPPQPPKES